MCLGSLIKLVCLVLGALRAQRDGHHRVFAAGVNKLHAHRIAASHGHIGDGAANDLTRMLDRNDLVIIGHNHAADQAAALVVQAHRLDAKTPATLNAVFADRGTLGVTLVGDGEDVKLVLVAIGGNDAHAKQLVALAEPHAGDAGSGAAHRANLVVGGIEPDGLPLLRNQQDVVLGVDQPCADQLVFLIAEVDGDQACLTRRIVGRKLRLLDQALAGGKQQIFGVVIAAQTEALGDVLVGQEAEDASNMAALRIPARLRQMPALRAVGASHVGQEYQPIVVGDGEQVIDLVLGTQRCAPNALAAALLSAVLVDAGALDVTAAGDGDNHLLIRNEVLILEAAHVGNDFSAAIVTVLIDDLRQLGTDDLTLTILRSQNGLQVGNRRLKLLQAVNDLLALQSGQTTKLHVQNRLGLDLINVQQLLQALIGLVGVRRAANQRHNLVDHVERLNQTSVDVGLLLSLGQAVCRAPLDDLHLVGDPVADELIQTQRTRDFVNERQHVAAEVILQLSVLVKVVHHDARLCVTLQRDDQALAGTCRRVVADIGDALQLAGVDQIGDLLRQVVRVTHVRQLGDDQVGASGAGLLNVDDRAHLDRTATGAVGVLDALAANDLGAGREVRALHPFYAGLEQFLLASVRVVQAPPDSLGDLAQVVRRNVGGHAHRDALRAVNQQVREPRWQHNRLLIAVVVVRLEIDGVLVDVPDHLHGQRRHLALGVTHRSRRVVTRRTKVALTGNQRGAHNPALR